MKPMLLTEYPHMKGTISRESSVFIQPKLDGWRCVINTKNGLLYSRSGKAIVLPHIIKDIINNNYPEWLDGELYCHGKSLSEIQSMIKNKNTEIKFYCFDIINNDLFDKRLSVLNKIKETDNIRIIHTYKINPCHINKYYNQYIAMGFEGAVVRLNKLYENKRSENIVKIKPVYDNF